MPYGTFNANMIHGISFDPFSSKRELADQLEDLIEEYTIAAKTDKTPKDKHSQKRDGLNFLLEQVKDNANLNNNDEELRTKTAHDLVNNFAKNYPNASDSGWGERTAKVVNAFKAFYVYGPKQKADPIREIKNIILKHIDYAAPLEKRMEKRKGADVQPPLPQHRL